MTGDVAHRSATALFSPASLSCSRRSIARVDDDGDVLIVVFEVVVDAARTGVGDVGVVSLLRFVVGVVDANDADTEDELLNFFFSSLCRRSCSIKSCAYSDTPAQFFIMSLYA